MIGNEQSIYDVDLDPGDPGMCSGSGWSLVKYG